MGVFDFFQGVRVKAASDAGYAFKLALVIGLVLSSLVAVLALGLTYWTLSNQQQSKRDADIMSTAKKLEYSALTALVVFVIGMVGALLSGLFLSLRAKKMQAQKRTLEGMTPEEQLLYASERTAAQSARPRRQRL